MQRSSILIRLVVMGLLALGIAGPAAADDAARWESDIQAFEKRDHAEPSGGILFVGSSSIRRWDTEQCFPEHRVINRGFGGSQMSDVLHFWDRLVLSLRPRLIVLYEGDNDIAKGDSAESVTAEFEELARRIETQLPGCRLLFLSIKPSLKRWELYPEMKKANRAIGQYCQERKSCSVIDVSQVMLGENGKPLPELFVADGLHLNEAGYAKWTMLVKSHMDQ